MSETLPPALAEVVEEFQSLDRDSRLELLLEYAQSVPELPARFRDHADQLERVEECQTPFFAAVELDDGKVRLFFEAPPESPTTRGFAGILYHVLEGASPQDVLAVPGDLPGRLGLSEALSPQRARGIGAILRLVQRQVLERMASGPSAAK